MTTPETLLEVESSSWVSAGNFLNFLVLLYVSMITTPSPSFNKYNLFMYKITLVSLNVISPLVKTSTHHLQEHNGITLAF